MERSSMAALRVAHLGKILSGFAILGTVACLASIAYFLFIAVYYIFLIAILLGTLFMILIEYPEFMNLFGNTEAINEFVYMFSATYVPVIAPITIAISALSIVTLVASKQKDVTARIVFSAICFIVSSAVTVISVVTGGAQ